MLLVVAVILANEVLVYLAFGLTGVSVLLVALGLFAPNLGRRPAADVAPQQAGGAPPSVSQPMGQPPVSAQPTQWTPPPMATPPRERWQYPTTGPGLVPAPAGPRDPERGGGSGDEAWSGPPAPGGPVVDIDDSSSPAGAAGDPGAGPHPVADLPNTAPTSDVPVDDEVPLDTTEAAPDVDGDDGADLVDPPVDPDDDTEDDVVDAETEGTPDAPEAGLTEPPTVTHTAEEPREFPVDGDAAEEDEEDGPEQALGVLRSPWDPDVFATATADHTQLDRDPSAGPQPEDPTEPEDSTTFALAPEDLADEGPRDTDHEEDSGARAST
ncbi:hypothetical protein J4H86_04855 [Spiractinospora alimapuensis]|uniref:hypothetical protein n=1 Tax=Spiractinospora alimapuensis TaxID=2820884 RepID=UPI001F299EC1|nr:hypothetical protein [Spiractinospora alimapuensis]QVQ53125.1 hypothetical protein J4H86_04855 [Spiractinospora alimapuensis]